MATSKTGGTRKTKKPTPSTKIQNLSIGNTKISIQLPSSEEPRSTMLREEGILFCVAILLVREGEGWVRLVLAIHKLSTNNK